MKNSDFGEPLDKECPYCGCADLTHTVEQQPIRFNYGPGDVLQSTVLVDVPVTTCTGCKEAWTDARAEPARIEAAKRRREAMGG